MPGRPVSRVGALLSRLALRVRGVVWRHREEGRPAAVKGSFFRLIRGTWEGLRICCHTRAAAIRSCPADGRGSILVTPPHVAAAGAPHEETPPPPAIGSSNQQHSFSRIPSFGGPAADRHALVGAAADVEAAVLEAVVRMALSLPDALALCRRRGLHRDPDAAASSSPMSPRPLTLAQLVPVHAALLATTGRRRHEDGDSPGGDPPSVRREGGGSEPPDEASGGSAGASTAAFRRLIDTVLIDRPIDAAAARRCLLPYPMSPGAVVAEAVSPPSLPEPRLLALQYLLLHQTAGALRALARLVLPYYAALAEGPPAGDAAAGTDSGDGTDGAATGPRDMDAAGGGGGGGVGHGRSGQLPACDDDDADTEALMDAVLDAVFLNECENSSVEGAQVPAEAGIEELLEALQRLVTASPGSSVSADSALVWKLSIRILARLLEIPGHQGMVQEVMGQHVEAGIRRAVTIAASTAASSAAVSSLMATLLNDYLPHIVADGSAQFRRQQLPMALQSDGPRTAPPSSSAVVKHLCEVVWELYRSEHQKPVSASSARVYLILTSIMCGLLPSLVPTPDMPAATAFHGHSRSEVWDFIYLCISQGLDAPKQGSWSEQNRTKESQTNSSPEHSRYDLLSGGQKRHAMTPTRLPADSDTLQLLRRRGLYMLHTLVQGDSNLDIWNKYAVCYETLEMESGTPHLIDQTWGMIAEIASEITEVGAAPGGIRSEEGDAVPPNLTWQWLKVMLARVLTTHEAPTVRKLSLFRLFVGEAGILLDTAPSTPMKSLASNVKHNGKKSRESSKARARGMPLSMVTPDFMIESVLLSFDTLAPVVGRNLHLFDQDKKETRHNMTDLFINFLCSYVRALQNNHDVLREFWLGICDVIDIIHRKTAKIVFVGLAAMLAENGMIISMDDDVLAAISETLHKILLTDATLIEYKSAILRALSVILVHSVFMSDLKPSTILGILGLFPLPDTKEAIVDATDSIWIDRDVNFSNLARWLGSIKCQDPTWGVTFGAGVSTAFVDGLLTADATTTQWDTLTGLSDHAKEMGNAIVLFCTLIAYIKSDSTSASGLLWPAIHKGVKQVPMALADSAWMGADKISRAIVMLEYGCKFRILTGMGNGDLLLDRKSLGMMPPPQHIESVLRSSVDFILRSIEALLPSDNLCSDSFQRASARSPIVRQATESFGYWIGILHTLHEGFPSSIAVSEAVDSLLKQNLDRLTHMKAPEETSSSVALIMATIYASLSSGAHMTESRLPEYIQTIMRTDYTDAGRSAAEEQTSRSIFQAAKWGSLSLLLKQLANSTAKTNVKDLADSIFETIDRNIHVVSFNAMYFVFGCLITIAECEVSPVTKADRLETIIRSSVSLMNETKTSHDFTRMLDGICQLIFRPELLLTESMRLTSDSDAKAPIRDAFRAFIEQAGAQRIHISATVLSRIVYGWLGSGDGPENAGVAAIPYREDIASLLLFKEDRLDEASINQNFLLRDFGDILPISTDERSISRGFVIAFISKLPSADSGLSPLVLSHLCQFLILRLLKDVKTQDQTQMMLGSPLFCRRMRGWQALCVLSRFITREIAENVCVSVMQSFGEQLYGQIRYFLEVFTIQATRKFPDIFGRALLNELRRSDLSVQHVASLCIVVGTLTSGRYRISFFLDPENVQEALMGVLPWLGSTQGFARAIAQLLAYELIPCVIDVRSTGLDADHDNGFYLRSIYDFLEKNGEMKRLRNKQTKFFESYDADTACSLEGILQVHVDEGGEALPRHLVAVMKDTLKTVFAESSTNQLPEWKHVETMFKNNSQKPETDDIPSGHVNFQRKIIPLDALNLALEDERARKQRNRAGRRKQRLIVCASLVDKAPNLAGLARTSEIFAADRLVVPDLRLTQMDNFKSISVTASDWIDIEECKESELLPWLLRHRRAGWFIVGLEQTASSRSLADYAFPDRPTVLLLGKEKEGIPVPFLRAVDQCLEIPQLGVIRSLNVHVSGAIAVWERTRQRIAAGPLGDTGQGRRPAAGARQNLDSMRWLDPIGRASPNSYS